MCSSFDFDSGTVTPDVPVFDYSMEVMEYRTHVNVRYILSI